MISKNNHQVYQQKLAERKQRWGIRKLSVGVASVLLGTTFMLYSNHAVLADTVPTNDTVKANSSDPQGSKTAADKEKAVGTTTNAEEKVVATNPKDTTQDTTNVDKKDPEVTPTNDAKTPATQNTTNVGEKDPEVTPANDAKPATPKTTAAPAARTAMKAAARPNTTAKFKVLAALPKMKAAPTTETPDPTAPDNSVNTAIINNPKNLANDWMQLKQGKLKLYLTVRGLDNKTYVDRKSVV